jgi:NAD(P)-dependent dehydrogenase (short-subunit alcohol dehydrogenase family)
MISPIGLILDAVRDGRNVVDLGIAGKVALIAGGSKGMGRRAAELLAAEGAAVAVIGLEVDKEAMDAAVEGIEAMGGRAIGPVGR